MEPTVAGRRSPDRARITEIVGLPGAGKSTLLSALAARRPGIKPIARWRPLLSRACVAREAVALLPVCLAQWSARQTLVRRDIERMVRLRASRRTAERWGREVVVMDQGPIYTLGTLRLLGRGPESGGPLGAWWSRTAQEWACLLDAVIYLEAEEDVVVRRIMEREKAHPLKLGLDAERTVWLARLREALERTVDAFRAASGLAVLRFDTGREALPWIVDRVSERLDGE